MNVHTLSACAITLLLLPSCNKTPIQVEVSEIESKKRDRQLTLLMSGSPHCPSSRKALPEFEALCREIKDNIKCVYEDEYNDMKGIFDSTPTFAIFDSDSIIDYTKGVPPQGLKAKINMFLSRNKVLPIKVDYRNKNASPKLGVPRSFLTPRIGLSNLDLRNENLSDLNLTRGSFDSSNLSGANLSNTILNGSNMSHTNLKDANLDGSSLVDIYWNNTVCPDGSISDNRPNKSCVSK